MVCHIRFYFSFPLHRWSNFCYSLMYDFIFNLYLTTSRLHLNLIFFLCVLLFTLPSGPGRFVDLVVKDFTKVLFSYKEYVVVSGTSLFNLSWRNLFKEIWERGSVLLRSTWPVSYRWHMPTRPTCTEFRGWTEHVPFGLQVGTRGVIGHKGPRPIVVGTFFVVRPDILEGCQV